MTCPARDPSYPRLMGSSMGAGSKAAAAWVSLLQPLETSDPAISSAVVISPRVFIVSPGH